MSNDIYQVHYNICYISKIVIITFISTTIIIKVCIWQKILFQPYSPYSDFKFGVNHLPKNLVASLTLVIEVICVIDCLYFRPTQKISTNRQNQKLLTLMLKTLRHLHHTRHDRGVLACLHKVLQSFLHRTLPPPVSLQTPRALK